MERQKAAVARQRLCRCVGAGNAHSAILRDKRRRYDKRGVRRRFADARRRHQCRHVGDQDDREKHLQGQCRSHGRRPPSRKRRQLRAARRKRTGRPSLWKNNLFRSAGEHHGFSRSVSDGKRRPISRRLFGTCLRRRMRFQGQASQWFLADSCRSNVGQPVLPRIYRVGGRQGVSDGGKRRGARSGAGDADRAHEPSQWRCVRRGIQ